MAADLVSSLESASGEGCRERKQCRAPFPGAEAMATNTVVARGERTSVIIVAPDPDWQRQFDREAARLSAALGSLPHAIHHIGSTAITGMVAKPIIDLLLEVDELASLQAQTAALCAIGYEAMGAYGIPQRLYFRRTAVDGRRTHHLHSYQRGSAGAVRHLAFRDYMNAHPIERAAYAELKLQLAARCGDDVRVYVAGKDAFVKQHEALALLWRAQSIRRE